MDFLSFREEITKYIFAEDMLQKADIILIPGNAYPQNAERAAALYRQGYAPYILPSGKYSTLVGHFAGVLDRADRYNKEYKTEWEFLKDVLVQNGVDESAILKEDQATFTWENAKNSRIVTDQNKLVIQKAILCCRNCKKKSYVLSKIFSRSENICQSIGDWKYYKRKLVYNEGWN